jgi:hypothetical protein
MMTNGCLKWNVGTRVSPYYTKQRKRNTISWGLFARKQTNKQKKKKQSQSDCLGSACKSPPFLKNLSEHFVLRTERETRRDFLFFFFFFVFLFLSKKSKELLGAARVARKSIYKRYTPTAKRKLLLRHLVNADTYPRNVSSQLLLWRMWNDEVFLFCFFFHPRCRCRHCVCKEIFCSSFFVFFWERVV